MSPAPSGPAAPVHQRRRSTPTTVALLGGAVICALALRTGNVASATRIATADGPATVWLCRPALTDDPCASSLQTTVVERDGARSVVATHDAIDSRFDCFYVYPTVSTETSLNADLTVQPAEVATATAQAAPFSTVCRVFAPMYRQVTVAGIAASPGLAVPGAETAVATASIEAGFTSFLARESAGRPFILIGHSQGAVMVIKLLQRYVDHDPTLRRRFVLAIILGGNVEVRDHSTVGGSFTHLPICTAAKQDRCVIAYSSFPSEPPPNALFGRPGQGISLQDGATATSDLHVACVNPAAESGGSAVLDPLFPSDGGYSTPWVGYPGRYSAACESRNGATWLEVAASGGAADRRPVVSETLGPTWGYHLDDVNLALSDLVADTAQAEATWSSAAR